ncbi:MAG: redox-sensing transcriptional repressor Rex [Lachnospiraceae bacterium]|nr:redox-sensing transcriptional repressor Rex [Candidatus Equihabitans merdae]
MDKKISKAVISRMPRYYRYLGALMQNGIERISSKDLSERMNITASQIRQDLNNFGGFGQQGYGYNVAMLHDEIGKILGIDNTQNVIIVGVGNIGHALARFLVPDINGFHLCGLFDANPALKGMEISGIKVQSMDEFAAFTKENQVDIAILTVPHDDAKDVAEEIVANGINAIWNFALIDLNLSKKDVVIENVHLVESLMRLSYNRNNQ